MEARPKGLSLSATELIAYLGCRHAAFLDLNAARGAIRPPKRDDEELRLRQKLGYEHELKYLATLEAQGLEVAEIGQQGLFEARVTRTLEAMQSGAQVIYQAALEDEPWFGVADFLIRTPKPSRFGAFSYEILDTKLARSPEPRHLMQLAVYARLLEKVQGGTPDKVHLFLGDGSRPSFPLSHFVHYSELARERFQAFAAQLPIESSAEPCALCAYCRWIERCETEWRETDHLCQVANITAHQRAQLRAAGVSTMRALACLPGDVRVPKIQPDTLARLTHQARLQNEKRETSKDKVEVLPPVPGRGFARLPRPDAGDLFFDMEGDPLIPGGKLEYLFGFAFPERGNDRYVSFWAHNRADEKRAFERAMDFIAERLGAFPDAHIYHYAGYEQTAFNALSLRHATREKELDELLRKHKFVDLYRVAREALRVSEPSYSIKNLEVFYMKRDGGIASGGDSIVAYERWRELGDQKILDEIGKYNETDCISTLKLRDWLLTKRPGDIAWYVPSDEKGPDVIEKLTDAELRREGMTRALLGDSPESEHPFRGLVSHLLEFHRREAKPRWWAIFARREMSDDELIDDIECLGKLRRINDETVRHPFYCFSFPPQDTKLDEGDKPSRVDKDTSTVKDLPGGEIVNIDKENCVIRLRVTKNTKLPEAFSLVPNDQRNTDVLRDAIYRYAESVTKNNGRYPAVTNLLRNASPRLEGTQSGQPIIGGKITTESTIDAIKRLDRSTLVIQGPPGSGKTFTAARAIVALLKEKKRVGVTSNSHKVIVEVLETVDKCAQEAGVPFRGIKKGDGEDGVGACAFIRNTAKNEIACSKDFDLVGGTAWLFAREEMVPLDYLFIDEAGQVSLANFVAVGTSAKNIVLIGDQNQLAQPVQGVHPDESGQSALEYALGARETVPPEMGIFLDSTWRMHPKVCSFVSKAFYEGRLEPVSENKRQKLVLGPNADAALKETGISFVEVTHERSRQSSEEEAERLKHAWLSLLEQSWINREGKCGTIGAKDILVVSPYNMQVDLLRKTLPHGALVGTVDKFQGQEAAAVLISMATSSAEEAPRGLDFLFSRNRLNVAISRARCLAVIFASPGLLEAPVRTVEQLRLVDAFCWAKLYADGRA